MAIDVFARGMAASALNSKATGITEAQAEAKFVSKEGGSISGDLAIGGNLTVNGSTSTVDTKTLQVEDKLIKVAKDNAVALTTPAGIVATKYDGTNDGGVVFDNSGTAYVGDIAYDTNGNIDVNNSDLEPLATRDAEGNITDGQFMVWDATNKKLVGVDAYPKSQVDELLAGKVDSKLPYASATGAQNAYCWDAITKSSRWISISPTSTAVGDIVARGVGGRILTGDAINDDEAITLGQGKLWRHRIKLSNTNNSNVGYLNIDLQKKEAFTNINQIVKYLKYQMCYAIAATNEYMFIVLNANISDNRLTLMGRFQQGTSTTGVVQFNFNSMEDTTISLME